MNYTTNYQLNKPERNEQFNIDHWNNNSDAIDARMHTNQVNIATNASNIATLLTNLTTNKATDTDSTYFKLMKLIYPVGSIYWSSKSTNPSTLFGGTWVQIKDKFIWAKGDGDTLGATGGAKTVTLTVENLPSHNHSFTPSGTITMNSHTHGLNNHTHSFTPSGTVSSAGSHYHYFEFRDDGASWSTTKSTVNVNAFHSSSIGNVNYDSTDIQKSAGSIIYYPNVSSIDRGIGVCLDTESDNRAKPVNTYLTNGFQSSTSWSGYHKHSFIGANGTTGGNSGDTTSTTSTGSFSGIQGTTGSKGSGTAVNKMPPYIVKYCWERTA